MLEVKTMEMPNRRLAHLPSAELLARAADYRRMARTASPATTRAALDRLAIRFAMLAAKRKLEERGDVAADRPITELNKLVEHAEYAAACHTDPVRMLADFIRSTVAGDADPYLVMGVLVEGAVYALVERIPPAKQADTAKA